MDKQIDQAIRRTRTYKYIDGTYELQLGLTLLLIGAYGLVPLMPQKSGLGGLIVFILGLILIGLGPWLIDRIVRMIKERYTYRRSGYASVRKRKEPLFPPDTMVLFALLGFLAWVVLFSFVEEILTSRWLPLLPAVILMIIVGLAGIRSGLKRLLVLAFVGLLVGFILAWADVGSLGASGNIYLALMGVFFLAAGIYTLRNYLKNNPPPVEAADEQ